MARYPWSMLGIDKTLDERSIKSAYAQRLKSTRPEDDPWAFQALVEARNAALAIAKGNGRKKPQKRPEIAGRLRPTKDKPRREPVEAADPGQIAVLADAGAAERPAARRKRTSGSPARSAGQIVAPIVAFLGPFGGENEFDAAKLAIKALRDGSLGLRIEAEPILLDCVADFLLPDTGGPNAPEGADQRQRDGYIVVAMLDMEFGWSDNFTRLSKMHSMAKELTQELCYIRYGREPINASDEMPFWIRFVGKWVIIIFFFQIFIRVWLYLNSL